MFLKMSHYAKPTINRGFSVSIRFIRVIPVRLVFQHKQPENGRPDLSGGAFQTGGRVLLNRSMMKNQLQ